MCMPIEGSGTSVPGGDISICRVQGGEREQKMFVMAHVCTGLRRPMGAEARGKASLVLCSKVWILSRRLIDSIYIM